VLSGRVVLCCRVVSCRAEQNRRSLLLAARGVKTKAGGDVRVETVLLRARCGGIWWHMVLAKSSFAKGGERSGLG
jgi:hypothetical protein